MEGDPSSLQLEKVHAAAAAAAESLQACLTLCGPMDSRPPGSPSTEFSRQEYWRGLPFPSPEKVHTQLQRPRTAKNKYIKLKKNYKRLARHN